MLTDDLIADSPEAVGVASAKLEKLFDRIKQEVDDGLLPAAQVALARDGKLAGMLSYGDCTDDKLFHFFSASKAITSACGWLLIQDGNLDENERVADIVPEFGTHDKDIITVQQLFTHTCGFPRSQFPETDWWDKEARCRHFADWKLDWEVGSRFEYHPATSMYLVAEIIERRSGKEFQSFIRERIAKPLGLPELYVGCPREQQHRAKDLINVGERLSVDEYVALGFPPFPEEIMQILEDAIVGYNRAEYRDIPTPSGGAITSAAEMALFYQIQAVVTTVILRMVIGCRGLNLQFQALSTAYRALGEGEVMELTF